MKKKLIAVFLCAAMGVLQLTGCGSSSTSGSDNTAESETSSEMKAVTEMNTSSEAETASENASAANDTISGTISFWAAGDRSNPSDLTYQWTEETIKKFEEKYPNCKVDASFIASSDDYLTKITSEVAAGNAPDVFQTHLTGRLEPFVKAGKVMELSDFFTNYPESKSIMNDAALKLATFDGKVYAIPTVASGEMFFYNKDMFSKNGVSVPKTYNDLLKIIDTFKSKKIVPCILGISSPWPGTVPYMMLFNRMNGNDLYEKVVVNKQADFANQAFIDTGKKLKELVNRGMFNDSIASISQSEAREKFMAGDSAMIIDGSWSAASFIEKMGDNVGIFNFPDMDGEKGSSNDWLMNFDNGFAISADTKNKAAAEALMGYIFSQERQAAYAETGTVISCSNVNFDQSKLPQLTQDIVQAFNHASYTIIPWDNLLGTDVGAELNNTTQKIITGGDAKEAFSALQDYAKDAWSQ